MGTALSERLIGAEIAVIGFDVDPARCEKLKASGGMVATSVRELAARCRTIVIAVYSGEQVEALLADLDEASPAATGRSSARRPARPTKSCALQRARRAAGLALIEAPISGTSAEVADGTAMALIAGDADAIEAVDALLDILCPHRMPVGNDRRRQPRPNSRSI